VEADEARVVTSARAVALLAELPPYDASAALSLGSRLRAGGEDPALVSAVLTQSRLRARAAAKFGEFASGMLLTADGLEMATRLSVAARHAARYRDAGIERVADVTCGIGADAMAMSALGIAVMAFERDEATALIADHNLRHWPASVVVHADALSVVRDVDVDAVFADPGRRGSKARRRLPDTFDPPLADVVALRDTFAALGVKLGPGLPHAAIPPGAEAEWVSDGGDVVEVGLWFGPLSRGEGRAALVLDGGASHRLADSGATASVGPLADYLYEPDGAVIRAGLVAEVASDIGGALIDRSIAYVTGPRAATSFATRYRVIDDLPFSVKTLRTYLRERSVGRIEIKKRGTAVTPETLRPQLGLRGDGEACIVLTRIAGTQRAIVVERS
jgi:hypothetical protein